MSETKRTHHVDPLRKDHPIEHEWAADDSRHMLTWKGEDQLNDLVEVVASAKQPGHIDLDVQMAASNATRVKLTTAQARVLGGVLQRRAAHVEATQPREVWQVRDRDQED
jgi:hypothetical protein